MSNQDQNPYGMALSHFTYGYIYDKFAEYLHNGRRLSIKFNDDQEEYILGDEMMCKRQALKNYEDAFDQFKQVNHIMGKYLSKLGARDMYNKVADGEDSSEAEELEGQL